MLCIEKKCARTIIFNFPDLFRRFKKEIDFSLSNRLFRIQKTYFKVVPTSGNGRKWVKKTVGFSLALKVLSLAKSFSF